MVFRIVSLCLLILPWSVASADEYRSKINEGYDYYKNGQYDKAADFYKQAGILKPDKALPKLGKGAALYKSNNYKEAAEEFSSRNNADNDKLAADMSYNLGNSLFRSQDYAGAVKSYIEALKKNPGDRDYKHNLELALLRQQQQQQQQNKNQDKDKEKQDQKDQDKQNKEDQQQNENQQQDQQQQDQRSQQRQAQQQDQQQQDKQEQQAQGQQKMSEEEAKNILARFAEDEKEIQKRLKQVNIMGGSSHDW